MAKSPITDLQVKKKIMRSFRWVFIMGTMVSAPQEVLAYRKSLSKGFEIFCMIAIVILVSILGLCGLFAYFESL
jgi:hypothetical protein